MSAGRQCDSFSNQMRWQVVKNLGRFRETNFSADLRASIGIDLTTGGHYLSFPVSLGVVDYDEQYRLTPEQYEQFSADIDSALTFVAECRARRHDDLLIYRPRERRGTPI